MSPTRPLRPLPGSFLAGVNFDLAPNLSADLGYRYFGTNPSYTLIDTTYRAQAVTLGINFHF